MDHFKKIPVIIAAFLLLIVSSCKKKDEASPAPETGTVTDIDGNVYKAVKIGSQWWMAEDLKVSRYRNGDSISQIQDTLLWSMNDSIGAFCRSEDALHTVVGRLYNWYAVSESRNLAPEGWHIPSDDEWKQLEKELGMSASAADEGAWRGTNEGDKLKVLGPQGWTQYGKVWGTNESGFSAYPAGCRMFNHKDGDPGFTGPYKTGFWWSSTSHPDNDAWYRYLDYKNSNIFRSHTYKNYGFSVRCVRD